MTTVKKAPRKKPYKNMSVSELVAARKELATKMEQIDIILNEAVQAIGNVKNINNVRTNINKQNSYMDPAFAINTSSLEAQVAINTEAPILPMVARNNPDQSSGFSIFNAEAAAQEQAKAEEEYLANNPSVDSTEYFNDELISKEINELKNEIGSQITNHVRDTETTSG